MKSAKFRHLDKIIANDMEKIREDLSGQELATGAYCQDYDTFKIIYQFVEHRLRRTRGRAYIILLTLADGEGDFPDLQEKDQWMETLKGLIQNSLRSGDMFTRYSRDQYLIMILDLSEEDAKGIVDRIAEAFYSILGDDKNRVLLHHCYPMMIEQQN